MERISRKVPVFVVGAPRSGTTFLTRLMNRFLDVHVARDAGTILRFKNLLPEGEDFRNRELLRSVVTAMFKDHFFNKRILQRGLTLSVEEVIEQFQGKTYAELIHFIMSQMAFQQGKTRWGNKRPSYALHITELAQLFPEAKFLHIVRDGRDVAYSMRRATQAAFERNWYFSIKDWEYHVKVARTQGHQLKDDQYQEIYYEELMKKPVETLRKVVLFMSDAEENIERLEKYATEIKKMIKPGNFDKWKHQIPHKAIAVMEKTAGKTLQEFGYELMFPQIVDQSIPFTSKMVFWGDNLLRKIFSSTTQKAVLYRLQWFRTRLRIN